MAEHHSSVLTQIRRSHLAHREAEVVVIFTSSVIEQRSPAGMLSLNGKMLNRVMSLIIKGHLLVAVNNQRRR